jgi:hypothetical protein
MSLEDKRRLILELDFLIRTKTPGKPEALARRLGVSRSTLFRLIEYMKGELNAPVMFDAVNDRYIYGEEGIVMFSFLPYHVIDMKQAKKIVGGRKRETFEAYLNQCQLLTR